LYIDKKLKVMKVYIYYSRFDSGKEPQGRIKAKDLQEAIHLISQIKQLNQKEFLQIFEIKEI
jgi:hypothetical protein